MEEVDVNIVFTLISDPSPAVFGKGEHQGDFCLLSRHVCTTRCPYGRSLAKQFENQNI